MNDDRDNGDNDEILSACCGFPVTGDYGQDDGWYFCSCCGDHCEGITEEEIEREEAEKKPLGPL